MIAEVVFDVLADKPRIYSVPGGTTVVPGQRVLATVGGAARVGLVVGVHPDGAERAKPLAPVLDAEPVLSCSQLELTRWIARESCSPLGSTSGAFLPPVVGRDMGPSPPEWVAASPPPPELWTGPERAQRLFTRLQGHPGGILVLTAQVESAAAWSERLTVLGKVVRLDRGAPERERSRGWRELAAGTARIAVGTRSALLAPIPAPAAVALIDEHDLGHKPPGSPRMHARDVLVERARIEGSQLYLVSPTPSVEAWWGAERGEMRLDRAPPGRWPAISIVDTRGASRREPLTPALVRATREALRRRQRVLILVHRLLSALACDECGIVLRCPSCGIALAFSRRVRMVACRQCGRVERAPDTCPACGGRRVAAFGASADRVEHALRRRFPRARIARYDADSTRRARLQRQTLEAASAQIVVGTRGAIRLFEGESLGAAGLVGVDQLLRIPNFRASERALQQAWATAERVDPDGQVVIQSSTPDHYAFRAVAKQDLAEFYTREVPFRAELGYPPFRRLCRLTVSGKAEAPAHELAAGLVSRLGEAGVSVYPPVSDRRGLCWTVLAKGGSDLAATVAGVIARRVGAPRRGRPVVEVEMDPTD